MAGGKGHRIMVHMAKIVHSDAAPSESVHYVFAGVEFDLGGRKKVYETDDAEALANAEAHPWLTVEYEEVEQVQGAYIEQLKPEEDHLSLKGRAINPNDPDEARKAEAAKRGEDISPVAIDAGEDQTEVVTTDGVAETLAADTSDKKDKN
jgi:hypothetical protein